MSQPLVYVDTSEVRNGALEELTGAVRELAEFVEENEPQLISYDVYFGEDSRQMTVIHTPTGRRWTTTWMWRGRAREVR